jgi:hypothetical protein
VYNTYHPGEYRTKFGPQKRTYIADKSYFCLSLIERWQMHWLFRTYLIHEPAPSLHCNTPVCIVNWQNKQWRDMETIFFASYFYEWWPSPSRLGIWIVSDFNFQIKKIWKITYIFVAVYLAGSHAQRFITSESCKFATSHIIYVGVNFCLRNFFKCVLIRTMLPVFMAESHRLMTRRNVWHMEPFSLYEQ